MCPLDSKEAKSKTRLLAMSICHHSTLLFLASKSSQNLQLCDEYLSVRYIAKYAAGIEERADSKIDPVSFKEIKIQSSGLRNVKIAGCKIKAKTNEKNLVQIIPQVEAVWWLLDFRYVYSSVPFKHLSTHEKTERGAFIKIHARTNSLEFPLAILKTFSFPTFRLNFPTFRQFTESQLLLLKDSLSSEYTRCKISFQR